MAKKELFIKRVYEIVNELKIPLIDERVYDRVTFGGSPVSSVIFKFEEDESVIRGFLRPGRILSHGGHKEEGRILYSAPIHDFSTD